MSDYCQSITTDIKINELQHQINSLKEELSKKDKQIKKLSLLINDMNSTNNKKYKQHVSHTNNINNELTQRINYLDSVSYSYRNADHIKAIYEVY